MITFDGIYVDDRLTDEEMYDVLAENITLDELKHIKINRAREEATTHLSEKYTTIYTEKLSRYAISILKSIRISDYDVSPYAVTYCGLYDKNKSTSKEQVSYFEHMIARNMFYLAIKTILDNRKEEYTHKGKVWRQQIAKLDRGKSKSKNR